MINIHRYFDSEEELQEFIKSVESVPVPEDEKPKIFLINDDTGEMTRIG